MINVSQYFPGNGADIWMTEQIPQIWLSIEWLDLFSTNTILKN